MELLKIREKKKELEIDILNKLHSFEEETDCYIRGVDLEVARKISRKETEVIQVSLDIKI